MLVRARPGPTSMIAIGAVSLLPFFALGGLAGDVYWNVVVAAMLAVGATAARRLRTGRAAWLWILGGQAMFLAGDIVWMVAERSTRGGQLVHVGDACYFVGYGAIATGLVLVSLRQSDRWDPGNVIDAGIVSIGAGVLLWVTLIEPVANDGSASLADRIIGVAYPVSDLVLIVIGARLATLVQRSRPAMLLLGSLGLLLAADVWFAYADLSASYSVGDPVDALWWMSYVLVVAAVLDPDVDELTLPAPEPAGRRLTNPRIAFLAGSALGAPALIAGRAMSDAPLELPVLLGGTMVLFVFVVGRLVVVAHELDEHRRRLQYEATHDPLTSLGSRVLFGERVGGVLAAAPTIRPAVLCVDLDDFKTVNDALGHAAGDRLLREIGRRLLDVAPDADDVARLGGDEFALVVHDSDIDGVTQLADRLLDVISRPVVIEDGTVVRTGASIGIAFGGPAATVDSLLRDADTAMYAAKRRGKGRWEVDRSGPYQLVVERPEPRRDPERRQHEQLRAESVAGA